MWETLTDPWTQPIMLRALAEVALLGVAGGTLGCWIVLYGLSYSAESLAHALFPGLVLAAIVGFPLLLGAGLGIVVAALAISLAGRTPEIGSDTAIAVVVTTLFGAGALLALSRASPPGIQGLMFGDILGVSDLDLALAAGFAVLLLAALRLLHGRLLVVGFDRGNASLFGASPLLADAVLLVLIAGATLVAVQGLGNLLVVAVLVGPAAAARLVAGQIPLMMALAVAIAIGGGSGGLYLSYYAGTAAGASVAGCVVALYLLALAAERARAVWKRAPSGA
jgi:ABC-type Mn2+/Zn2+ transport system permease subunit